MCNSMIGGWRIVLLAGVLAQAVPAGATTYHCVHDVAGFQPALTAAQNDAADNTQIVLIAAGHYALTQTLTYVVSSSKSVLLEGGYAGTTCSGTPDHAWNTTVLDGQNAVRPLYMADTGGNGSISIVGLTFVSGKAATGDSGGGLLIAASTQLRIEHSAFFGNAVSGGFAAGGGVYAVNSFFVRLLDNLFVANHGTQVGGALIDSSGGAGGAAYIYNNTIVGNISDTLTVPAGLLLEGNVNYDVTNNILWNNNTSSGGSDFGVTAPNTRRTNDIGVIMSGGVAGTVNGELSVDPKFQSCGFLCFDFELTRSSPLVDVGTDAAVPSDMEDLSGKPRKIGAHVDIGAFENDLIFADGFGS